MADTPVFPNSEGGACSKQSVVRTFREIAVLLGIPPDELEGIVGHLCRVTGAQHMAIMGLDIVLIRLMARWAGETVLRYIAEAPLGTITDAYKKLATGRSMPSQLEDLFSDISALKTKMTSMPAREMATAATLEWAAEEELRSDSRIENKEHEQTYLANVSSDKYHLPYLNQDGVVVANRAKSGWRVQDHESSVALTLSSSDPAMICGVCLPAHRRVCRAGQMAQLATPPLLCSSSSDSSS
jgi:hypothetical protein